MKQKFRGRAATASLFVTLGLILAACSGSGVDQAATSTEDTAATAECGHRTSWSSINENLTGENTRGIRFGYGWRSILPSNESGNHRPNTIRGSKQHTA